jgi:MoaA/NifB/PqqE/SkfB family radical SAM enzyme
MMSQHTFRSILRVLEASDLPMVSIVGFGEPLLHRRLTQMLGLLREVRPDLFLKVTSNGALLMPSLIDQLFASGLDLLEVSIVGISSAEYAAAMGGLSFAEVLAVVDRLRSDGRPFVIATLETPTSSADDIRRFWAARGVEHVEVKALHRRGGYLPSRAVPVRLSRGDYRSRPTLERPVDGRDGDEVFKSESTEACHKILMFLHVNADGDFIPCVQEINSKNVLFNIDEVDDYPSILRRTFGITPTFDICSGCELQGQDLVDYYVRFILNHAPSVAEALLDRRTATGG